MEICVCCASFCLEAWQLATWKGYNGLSSLSPRDSMEGITKTDNSPSGLKSPFPKSVMVPSQNRPFGSTAPSLLLIRSTPSWSNLVTYSYLPVLRSSTARPCLAPIKRASCGSRPSMSAVTVTPSSNWSVLSDEGPSVSETVWSCFLMISTKRSVLVAGS
jgi:hypothetical protein